MIYVPAGKAGEVQGAIAMWAKFQDLTLELSWVNVRALGLGKDKGEDPGPGFTSA